MENEMTDFQFKAMLKMILEIIKGSKDLEEAQAKIEKLLAEE